MKFCDGGDEVLVGDARARPSGRAARLSQRSLSGETSRDARVVSAGTSPVRGVAQLSTQLSAQLSMQLSTMQPPQLSAQLSMQLSTMQPPQLSAQLSWPQLSHCAPVFGKSSRRLTSTPNLAKPHLLSRARSAILCRFSASRKGMRLDRSPPRQIER